MTLHRLVDGITLVALGGIGIALAWVLVTRTGAANTATSAPVASTTVAAPTVSSAPTVVYVPAPVDDAATARLVREAVRREREAEDRRWVAAMCADPDTPYDMRQDLGCDGGSR